MNQTFRPRVKLRYPEFESHYKINEVLGHSRAYSFIDTDGLSWFEHFYKRLLISRDNKTYLPVYRMGDGEYTFLLGKNIYMFKSFFDLSLKQMVLKLKLILGKNTEGHVSGTELDGKESYTHAETLVLKQKFINDLRYISQKGILGLGLDEGEFYGKYMPQLKDTLDNMGVYLNSENYYHVYHVYALMASSYGKELTRGQHVLVVTSINEEKKKKFKDYLLREMDAIKVSFYNISPNKAMLDIVELETIEEGIDIVLVGAGVGAANILRQLEPLSVPCLDIGTVLGNMLDSRRRFARPYMVTDDKFALDKLLFLSKQQRKRLKASEFF